MDNFKLKMALKFIPFSTAQEFINDVITDEFKNEVIDEVLNKLQQEFDERFLGVGLKDTEFRTLILTQAKNEETNLCEKKFALLKCTVTENYGNMIVGQVLAGRNVETFLRENKTDFIKDLITQKIKSFYENNK